MIEVKIEGLKQIAEDFEKIPVTLGGAVLKAAVAKATQPLLYDMVRRAPYLQKANGPTLEEQKAARKEKGFRKAWPGQIQQSIKRIWIKNLPFPDLQVGCYIGPTVFTATFQEFGTAHQPARPFVGPAFDDGIEQLMGDTKEAVGQQIDKTLRKYGWR